MKIGRSGKSEGNADSLFHLTQRSRVQTNRNIARGTCVSSNNWIDSTDGRHAKNVLNVDERLCTPIFLSGSDVQRILQRLTHVEHDHNISAATRASSLHGAHWTIPYMPERQQCTRQRINTVNSHYIDA